MPVLKNPYLTSNIGSTLGDRSPGNDTIYPDWASVIKGVAFDNKSLGAGRRTLGGAAAPTSSRFSLLSLSKDPSQQTLLDNALTNLGRRTADNSSALGRFNSVLSDNNTANAGDIGQESNAINDVFTGKLSDSLRAANEAYKAGADTTNAGDAAALKAIRDTYKTDQAGAIKLLYANLGKSTDQYKTDTLGDIGNEVARRNADAQNFGITARRSTDQSIADASRENKAQFGQEGGGGSSYASRLGMAQRVRANTALSQALAELRMTNTEKELARHAELTDHLSTLTRGDITGEGQAGIGLNSDLNVQDYHNLGTTIGRTQAIQDTIGARDLNNLQFTQGQQNALLGARAGLRRSAAGDLLTGINANQQFDANDLRNLGLLGDVRRANVFTGIDDGTGDNTFFPRIPNYSRGPRTPNNPNPNGQPNPNGNPNNGNSGNGQPNNTTQAELDYFNRYGEWPYGNPPAGYNDAPYGATPNTGGTGTPLFPAGRYFDSSIPSYQGYDSTNYFDYANAA